MARFLLLVVLIALLFPMRVDASPVAVLVHGMNAGEDDLDPLAEYLDRIGYRVARFDYDDHEPLDASATELGGFVRALLPDQETSRLLVVGHSMGGLVARRAFTVGHAARLDRLDGLTQLITVASPLNGLPIADGSRADLGLGPESFHDLGRRSPFVRAPGTLPRGVRHVRVETAERGTQRRTARGLRSDAMIPVRAQRNPVVDDQAEVIRVEAGHLGVINTDGRLSPTLESALDRLLTHPRLLAERRSGAWDQSDGFTVALLVPGTAPASLRPSEAGTAR